MNDVSHTSRLGRGAGLELVHDRQSMVEIALTWLVATAVLVRYGPRDLARRGHAQPSWGR